MLHLPDEASPLGYIRNSNFYSHAQLIQYCHHSMLSPKALTIIMLSVSESCRLRQELRMSHLPRQVAAMSSDFWVNPRELTSSAE